MNRDQIIEILWKYDVAMFDKYRNPECSVRERDYIKVADEIVALQKEEVKLGDDK